MSHISRIKVEVKDLEVLRAACGRLGFQFMPGQKTYRWYGTFMGDYPLPEGISREQLGKCTHAIKVPGADYEVGILQQGDKFTLLYDFWKYGGLEDALGANAEKLIQAYAIEAAKLEAQRQGFSVYEETLQDGSVELHVNTEV
jgi:hypothetical protein